ncbi:VOC family protein [Saccharopolyspora taberi]|uniref:VOC domain-containing protein n=1 Tax=Saccharopolyspora taberi TaxID=60895 RepID=A0ABN3VAH4_9PSEU
MGPLEIHHVSLMVADLDDALDFYVNGLGLRPRIDRPDSGVRGAWLDLGDRQLHLIEGDPPPAAGQHFALRVSDLDAARNLLRDRGIAVGEPTRVGRARQAFLRDPSGNAIELHEPATHDGGSNR